MKTPKLNPELLKKFDIKPAELYQLLTILYAIDSTQINNLLLELEKKKLIEKFASTENLLFKDPVYTVTEEGKTLITSFLYEEKTKSNSEDLVGLVTQLREIFPQGNKTAGHPWRSNAKEVIEKLKKFKIIYQYTDDQIIEATQRYVNQMSGNDYMRTLKHFIIKKIGGENISDLASYIENDTSEHIQTKFSIKYNG